MDLLKMLAGLLGLPETATEDEVKKAIEDLLAKVQQSGEVVANKELLSLLELPDTASLADTKGKIIALKNPSGYVKAEEFKALQDKLALKDRDDLVEMAMKAGKITPAQKPDWEEFALKDPEGFKKLMKNAPVVVPVGPEIGGGDPAKQKELDEVQLSINKALGISDEDFKKFGGN